MYLEYTLDKTDIFGLIGIPNELNGNGSVGKPEECSLLERNILKDICLKFIHKPINIMEIGVYRNGENSFTKVLIDNKHPDSKYFGVDLDDKSFLNNKEKNIYTFQNNSFEFDKVVEELKKYNINNLDILFIDGEHIMYGAINDWRYSILVNPGGCVLIHDVNTHFGPNVLMQIIDPKLFEIGFLTKEEDNVYGLGIALKR